MLISSSRLEYVTSDVTNPTSEPSMIDPKDRLSYRVVRQSLSRRIGGAGSAPTLDLAPNLSICPVVCPCLSPSHLFSTYFVPNFLFNPCLSPTLVFPSTLLALIASFQRMLADILGNRSFSDYFR